MSVLFTVVTEDGIGLSIGLLRNVPTLFTLGKFLYKLMPITLLST